MPDNKLIIDLENKIKTLFLNNQELNQSNIDIAKNQALRMLIDNKIKKEEIDKYNFTFKKNDVLKKNLENIALSYNTNLNGIKKIFEENNINFEIYAEEIKCLLWNNLIFQLYGNKVNLNEGEIEKEIQKIIKSNKDLVEYKLAEIEIFFNSESEKKNKISNILNQIKDLGFENSAKKFSVSSTAQNGGNLGWINSKSLSEEISNHVKNLNLGDVSKPIVRSNNILFLKLIDKKKINLDNENLDSLEKKSPIKKKVKS